MPHLLDQYFPCYIQQSHYLWHRALLRIQFLYILQYFVQSNIDELDLQDRELFRSLMQEINEPVPESMIVHTVEEAVEFAKREGYPYSISLYPAILCSIKH